MLAGWVGAVLVRRHALMLRLVSHPNHRSSHVAPTPHGGGLGIVMGGSFAGLWLSWQSGSASGFAITGLALALAVVGFIDDIRHLPARLRFAVQLAVCGGLLLALGVITPMNDTAPPLSGGQVLFAVLLLVAGTWWINLFNFMDGIDGLAGSQAVFMVLAGAALSGISNTASGESATVAWMLSIAAATAGFLMLNWPPAKIFMGDVGSTYLAFMILAFALMTVKAGWLGYEPWLILGAVFLADTTVTLMRRMLAGERWSEAHRSHAYQQLARRLGAHRPVTLFAMMINTVWLAPLAWASIVYPSWGWSLVFMAYLPLVVMALMLGAGKGERA